MNVPYIAYAVIAFFFGLIFGTWLTRRWSLQKINDASKSGMEQGSSAAAVEVATLQERTRALIVERDSLSQERETLTASLDTTRAELSIANRQRAVAEVEAARLPELAAKQTETELSVASMSRLVADLRETTGAVNAQLQSERESVQVLRAELAVEKQLRDQAEARMNQLTTEVAELNGLLTSERGQAEEKLTLLMSAREALSNQFKSLASDILDEKSKKFTDQNQTNISQLLDPLRTKLTEFQGKVEEVYIQEGKDRSALAEQVRSLMSLNQTLSQDAKNLTSALKGSNKAQGSWGELILECVLEASGLRKGHEYNVQESHSREDGTRAQPDVVLHLPEERHLIIDAKVSLTAYDEYMSTENESERAISLKRHLDSVRGHMRGLSLKNYQALYGLKSLDFVLMFVPIEPAFLLALGEDQNLYMEAMTKNVLLVTPSTLLFVVRTVAHLWRQEAQSKNAHEIATRGAELYDRLVSFVIELDKVGERLGQARESFTNARNKLLINKGNVIRQAEMLKDLGVKPTKPMPAQVLDQLISAEEGEEAGKVVLLADAKALGSDIITAA